MHWLKPDESQKRLPWLVKLSKKIEAECPGAEVTWDTEQVTVSCKGLWFGTEYRKWTKEDFDSFEEECLRILEICT